MKMNKEHMPCEPKASGTLYRIGMFAAMNHVTVKALRFYEEQGLLEPAFIQQENGYRYYTLNQIADLHQISALKQAGFTLEEIGAVRTGADEGTILLKKKAELMTKIAQLTGQVAVIDRYIEENNLEICGPIRESYIDGVWNKDDESQWLSEIQVPVR